MDLDLQTLLGRVLFHLWPKCDECKKPAFVRFQFPGSPSPPRYYCTDHYMMLRMVLDGAATEMGGQKDVDSACKILDGYEDLVRLQTALFGDREIEKQ